MGDSDDEYDRRRRDKFRRERSDYDRSRERDERRRGDDWNDREWDRSRERRSRGEYRDYDRNRRERFSPPRHELSPPQKRMRRDWDEHSSDPYHSGYEMPYAGGGGGPTYGPPQPWGHPDVHIMQHHVLPIQARLGSIAEIDLGVPPPVMKTFKEFLLSLDDSVDETEAVKRYNDYKLDFRRQQMQDFFLAHKDEEWSVPQPPCRLSLACPPGPVLSPVHPVPNSRGWGRGSLTASGGISSSGDCRGPPPPALPSRLSSVSGTPPGSWPEPPGPLGAAHRLLPLAGSGPLSFLILRTLCGCGVLPKATSESSEKSKDLRVV